jgi:3',5'-nucleoside bisphosphate phosphatase
MMIKAKFMHMKFLEKLNTDHSIRFTKESKCINLFQTNPMHKLFIILLFFIFSLLNANAQHHGHDRKIRFPDIPGFKTLKCDLHQHTVFSDGSVWPDIRVMEAVADGMDVISLTEHLEYQPHKKDIPHPDRNRSWQIAMEEAKHHELIVVHGSEITRKMPPGHCNAIFISDANKLLVSDSMEIFREAKKQGAFVFWNHPNWTSQKKNGIATITEMHKRLISEKLIDGIEVVNEHTYSDEALQIALDNNLTIMGTSDIHELIDWEFNVYAGGHRPLTLVFAADKTEAGVKQALFEKRTVVYFKDLLIGRQEFLNPLLSVMTRPDSAAFVGKTDVLKIFWKNNSSAKLILANRTGLTFHDQGEVFELNPGEEFSVEIKPGKWVKEIDLKFEVMNAVYAPGRHPVIEHKVIVSKPWR